MTADAEAKWEFERKAKLSKGNKLRFKIGRGLRLAPTQVKNG